MSEGMIYLASPYSHSDPVVREARFQAVCKKAADLWREGHIVFSPIAHTHPIAWYGLPKGFDFFERFDRKMLEVCDELCVFQLPGWNDSKGVMSEIRIANELGMPISYIYGGGDE